MLSAEHVPVIDQRSVWSRAARIPKRLRWAGQTRYFLLAPAIGGLSADPVSSGRARSVDAPCVAAVRPATDVHFLVAASTYRCTYEGSVGVTVNSRRLIRSGTRDSLAQIRLRLSANVPT